MKDFDIVYLGELEAGAYAPAYYIAPGKAPVQVTGRLGPIAEDEVPVFALRLDLFPAGIVPAPGDLLVFFKASYFVEDVFIDDGIVAYLKIQIN